MDPALDRLTGALSDALGEPVSVVAAWADPPSPPQPPGRLLRAVYAFPSRRLATLRHWRDEVELQLDAGAAPTAVVALEASKWARLLLKSHGGTLLTSLQPPDLVGIAAANDLASLARDLWDGTASKWVEVAGIELGAPQPAARGLPDPHRFERVEGWLAAVRDQIDVSSGTGRRPGGC